MLGSGIAAAAAVLGGCTMMAVAAIVYRRDGPNAPLVLFFAGAFVVYIGVTQGAEVIKGERSYLQSTSAAIQQ